MSSTNRPIWQRLALPTWGVVAATYVGFLLLTWNFMALPLWLAAAALTLVLAWQGSLQHETIHGQPTRWRGINTALGWAPLALWLPYAVYRDTHLRHHATGRRNLTDPRHDPESHYVLLGTLVGSGPIRRVVLQLNCTLGGRLLLGPAIVVLRLWAAELHRLSDRRRLGIWVRHLAVVGFMLSWIVGVCKIPPLVYVAAVVYPSISLSLLRSFAEHHAASEPHHRTAVVNAHPFWALLFLNNQLHFVHHARPDLAWYQLPRAWRELAASVDIAPGLLFLGGYAEVVRRYLFRPFITVEHPAGGPL
jgi:fatty acid desaturase